MARTAITLIESPAAVRPAQSAEPPYTDPYVRWCGRGGAARLPPIPISCRLTESDLLGDDKSKTHHAQKSLTDNQLNKAYLAHSAMACQHKLDKYPSTTI